MSNLKISLKVVPIITLIVSIASFHYFNNKFDYKNTLEHTKIGGLNCFQIPFIENSGQLNNDNIEFYAATFVGSVFLTKDGKLHYAFTPSGKRGVEFSEGFQNSLSFRYRGEEKTSIKISSFKGNDPKKWRTNISSFNTIEFGEIYEGVNLKLQATGNNVEKIFYIQPNTNPDVIKINIESAENVTVNTRGELEVKTKLGNVCFTKPVAYQEENKERKFIDVSYNVSGDVYGFEVVGYDPTKELVIDPLLASTYLGGSHNEYAEDMLIDNAGNLYVTGWVASTDFPTTIGAYDTSHNGGGDVFVSKFDGSLQNLLASTFIGGGSFDQNPAIARDNNGNIFISGMTRSNDFPTTSNAFDTSFSDWSDCFISKFDSDLQNLLASTYLGGTNNTGDVGRDISIDDSGYVYVAGLAGSNFPTTPGAYDETINSFVDVFISKLDNNLTSLVASTYLGGNASDLAFAITFDDNGNVYTTGRTESGDFPFSIGAFDSTHNGGIYDAYISKFDPNLQLLLASTYLGGSGDEAAWDMVLDNTGNVLLTGETWSSDFPATASAYDTTYNGPDVFISKLNDNLTDLLASTYLGGSGWEIGYDIALNSSGNLFVGGMTSSIDFPVTPGAYDSTRDVTDAFIAKFDPNLANLSASTYLGGTAVDQGYALALNSGGEVYIGGETSSTDFPTIPGSYDNTYNGFGNDAFISKLDSNLSGGVVGIGDEQQDGLPEGFALFQNYPNPFNPCTKIKFTIPFTLSGVEGSLVTLKVYDVLGNVIATLVNEEKPVGVYEVEFDVDGLTSGIYFYQIKAKNFIETKKMIILK